MFEHGCRHRKLLEQWFAQQKDVPERTIQMGSYHAMLGCVLAWMGAALVPHSVIDTFPSAHRLRVMHLPEGSNVLRTMLAWPKGKLSSNVEALRNAVKDHADQARVLELK